MRRLCIVICSFAIVASSLFAAEGTVESMGKRSAQPAGKLVPNVSVDQYPTLSQQDLERLISSLKVEGEILKSHPAIQEFQRRAALNGTREGRRSLDQGADYCPATVIPGLPYVDAGTTAGMASDFGCGGNIGPDVVYSFTPAANMTVEITTCNYYEYDTRLELYQGDCSGLSMACNDDYCGLASRIVANLTGGQEYTIIVDAYWDGFGGYELYVGEVAPIVFGRCCYNNSLYCVDGIEQFDCQYWYGGVWTANETCNNPCPPPPPPPGALRVITVPVPSGLGVSISADCRGDLYYTNYGEGVLHQMNSFGVLISSNPIVDASGAPRYIDEMGWDESRQVFWGGELGTNAIWTVDRNGLATYQFPGMGGYTLTDGLDYDGTDGTVWHSTDVSDYITHFSATGLLLGTLTLLDENGNPEGVISGVEMGAGGTVWAGNSPIDDVRRCNKSTGAFISRFDAGQVRCEGMECDAINFAPQTVLWVKDAYNNTVTAFEIEAGTCVCAELPDTCQFPYEEVDHGDLAACNYPTLVNNPAHGLSGIAWLGPMVDGEVAPEILNQDQLPEDDGVFFANLPWTPCEYEDLRVVVTAGPEYARYAECGGRLYLNAWKDGNLDGDFCDEIICQDVPPIVTASEWIIQDVLVVPGAWPFRVLDPGVLDLGVYDGVFRFRLTSTPVGRFGFGQAVAGACSEQCGTFAFDFLGEVEDYIIADGQLDVELSSFDLVPGNGSVTVNWSTASETDNHHFLVLRDDQMMAQIASQGNSAAGYSYTWTDANVTNGTSYSYSLVAVDVNGAQEVLATASTTPRSDAGVVSEYALHQNFPNPFNPTTSIRFDLLDAGFTTLKVFNIQGQEVATLINGLQSAGSHTVNFDATGLPSGMYVYRLNVNGYSAQQKMMLLK